MNVPIDVILYIKGQLILGRFTEVRQQFNNQKIIGIYGTPIYIPANTNWDITLQIPGYHVNYALNNSAFRDIEFLTENNKRGLISGFLITRNSGGRGVITLEISCNHVELY